MKQNVYYYIYQEIKWLRLEIRKMGEEGVRLLDMRTREIGEMREHLQNMLRVMEQKSRTKSSSHILITRPPLNIRPSEAHLKSKSTGKSKQSASYKSGGKTSPSRSPGRKRGKSRH